MANPQTRLRSSLRRAGRHKGAVAGLVIVGALVFVALFQNTLAPVSPIRIDIAQALAAPGPGHPMGTDQYGRDTYSRVVHGSGISLTVGLISVGISGVPLYARLVRGSVLVAKEQLYVDAARVTGVPVRVILVRHILPNVVAPVIVAGTLGMGTAILAAAALSFIGLGSQPPTPEWGRMLSEGRDYLRDAWWISTFPGLAIMLTVLGVNMLGDGLRDVLDPQLKI